MTTKQKTLTVNELKDYILKQRKTNPDYLAFCEITENLIGIPKGTRLYFGISDNHISTYNEDTNNKNKKFEYNFDYGWRFAWNIDYKSKFILIDEPKMKEDESFTFQHCDTQEEVRKYIQEDEGHCTQQVCYSTFHDALTQINFTKRIIRSNLK